MLDPYVTEHDDSVERFRLDRPPRPPAASAARFAWL
jgi:hypothetical protein